MKRDEFFDQGFSFSGEFSLEDAPVIDGEEGFVIPIQGVDVRRGVFLPCEMHEDDNSVETGD